MAIKYTASDLRERVVIGEITYTTNDDYERVATVEERATVWAMLAPQSGRETMKGEQITPEPRALLVVRFRDWVTTNHIIILRGKTFEIHSIVDADGRRRFLELVISERSAEMLTQ